MFASQPASFQFGMTQSGTQLGNQDDPAAKKRQEEKQQVIPVTVRAVEEALATSGGAASASLQFYGGPAGDSSQLILVAVVEKLSTQTSSSEMILNDGTGRIKARYFPGDAAKAMLERISEGGYVSVVGSVRTTPEVHLGLLAIRPVASPDEVSYHTIECAHAAMRIRTGEQKTEALMAPSTQSNVTPSAPPPAAPQVSAETTVAASHDAGALKVAVLDTFRNEGAAAGEAGLSVGAIIAALARGASGAATELEIKKVLADLVDTADIFNTIDDDHFSAI